MNIEQRDEVLSKIAKDQLGMPTLKPRNSDSLDFKEVSVWSAKRALILAFEAGKMAK